MTIPHNAKKVFSGVIFSVYQWEQEMYDGTKEIFEAITRPDTIQILPTSGEHIFVSNEEQPMQPKHMTLLGGRAEEGEEPLTTAKRELLEETGMQSDDWELYKIYTNGNKIIWKTYLFIARNCKKIQEQQLDNGEKIEVKEISFEEFIILASKEDFWNKQIANDILRLKENSEKMALFKDKLLRHNPR